MVCRSQNPRGNPGGRICRRLVGAGKCIRASGILFRLSASGISRAESVDAGRDFSGRGGKTACAVVIVPVHSQKFFSCGGSILCPLKLALFLRNFVSNILSAFQCDSVATLFFWLRLSRAAHAGSSSKNHLPP